MGINKIFLLGNLGSDPELRFTATQQPVCSFRIATTEYRRGADGQPAEHTEWHSIVVWGKQAENCKNYLTKGRQVFIEGKIQTRKWQDQQGNARYTTEIVASNVQFIGGKDAAQSNFSQLDQMMDVSSPQGNNPSTGFAGNTAGAALGTAAGTISLDDDEIPF